MYDPLVECPYCHELVHPNLLDYCPIKKEMMMFTKLFVPKSDSMVDFGSDIRSMCLTLEQALVCSKELREEEGVDYGSYWIEEWSWDKETGAIEFVTQYNLKMECQFVIELEN